MVNNLFSNLKYKIKRILKNHKLFYLIIYILKNHKNSKVTDKIFTPENFIQIYSFGNLNKDKTIYFIDISSEYMGFGAYFRWTLEALWEADRLNLEPVVKFGKLCPYNENTNFKLGTNSYEYYFKQVSNISVREAMQSKNVFIFNQTDLIRVERELNTYDSNSNIICGYTFDGNYLDAMGQVVKKHIALNKETNEYIQKSIANLFNSKNEIREKILAIHIRGTDFALNWNRHPNMVTPEDYFPIIDKAIREYEFKFIFLATDDIILLKLFEEKYGDILLYFNDVNRSDGKLNVAYVKNNRENNNYLNGLEVVRDIYTMAYCDGLIAGLSQVSICARIINRSLEKQFEYERIIDNGIYKA